MRVLHAATTFEGEFSEVTRSYAGKGVVTRCERCRRRALSQEQSNGNMHQCVLATGAAAILPG
jgi:hypothetical protein